MARNLRFGERAQSVTAEECAGVESRKLSNMPVPGPQGSGTAQVPALCPHASALPQHPPFLGGLAGAGEYSAL